MSTHNPETSLLCKFARQPYESSKIPARARRAVAADAVAGRPGGWIPFGYRRVFDPQTRQLITQEPELTEAPVVAELYRRLMAGHSLHSIARDFEARGIRTRSELVFSRSICARSPCAQPIPRCVPTAQEWFSQSRRVNSAVPTDERS